MDDEKGTLSRRGIVRGAGIGMEISFDDQNQPWPGLARQMQPPPDHGEAQGSGGA